MQLLFPSADKPGKGDVAQLVGLAGLQRLRPIGALPVFRTKCDTRPRKCPLVNSRKSVVVSSQAEYAFNVSSSRGDSLTVAGLPVRSQ